MSVFVVDKRKKPLMPCTEKRARLLLERGRAVVHRRYPFTIRLKARAGGDVQPVRLKLDPGSKTTGIAIVQDPADAEAPSMPQSAIANVAVDYALPVAEIPPLLSRLAAGRDGADGYQAASLVRSQAGSCKAGCAASPGRQG